MSINTEKILKEKFVHPLQREYIEFQDFTISERYPELKDTLDNVEVNENDIWICTFPKVGTTWSQEMVWMIINNLDFEKGKKYLDERSPFIDFSVVFDDREWYNKREDYNPPLYRHDSIAFYKSLQSPKVVKTHLPFSFLPNQIKNGVKKPKMICVVRNSKDTCVSYYHHNRLLQGYTGTFEEWCELFLAGKVMYGPYWKHILEYWEKRHSCNILILKFEDMKKDIIPIIRQVCKFLNHSLTETQIQDLAKHLSFESMKNNPAVNREPQEALSKSLRGSTGNFMRSGKVGDYKTVMSPEVIKRFDEMDKKYFESAGLVF